MTQNTTQDQALKVIQGIEGIVQEQQEKLPPKRSDTTPTEAKPEVTVPDDRKAPVKAKKRPPRCRFFASKKGCRAGASCPFRHDSQTSNKPDQTASAAIVGVQDQQDESSTPVSEASKTPDAKRVQDVASTPTQPPRAVNRPVAQAEKQDPRAFQITQIERRFSPAKESTPNGDLLLTFDMRPSDPDFPFAIEALQCVLRLPLGFPQDSKPLLRITNKEMERGYQVNVEQGFDAIWSQSSAPTLLNAFKLLDKRLEALLTAQKAEMITIVANAGPKAAPATVSVTGSNLPISTPKAGELKQRAAGTVVTQVQRPAHDFKPAPVTHERREQARARRAKEVDRLEQRFGRQPQFSKGAGDTLFTLPLDPANRSGLPPSLQSLKTVRLLVPEAYDIEPASIELVGVGGTDAEKVERAFTRRASKFPETQLLGQINYLAGRMDRMARESSPAPSTESRRSQTAPIAAQPPTDETPNIVTDVDGERTEIRDTEKGHVKMITRPPEWDAQPEEDEGSSGTETFTDSEYEGDDGSDGDDVHSTHIEEQSTAQSSSQREKGILMSFPGLELYSIELLELVMVNLTVKCERCKDILDVPRIKPNEDASAKADDPSTKDSTIHTSCKKCAYPFSLAYRKDILHAHSTRAGYLDLDGCVVVDLLPSTFVPTCSSCSTPLPANQGVVATRAQSSLSICRTCHSKLSFLIPEVKFLRVSNTAGLPLKQVGRPKKEALGIVAGTELPDRGRCKHYGKSYRWFRFSCCNKVFPCDKCHDAATDHPNEFANRMICGWCSREQAYRPEDCGMQGCRRGITGRVRTGFWEGGKGTRDKARMSRKDPRKYKRRGGGTVKKQ